MFADGRQLSSRSASSFSVVSDTATHVIVRLILGMASSSEGGSVPRPLRRSGHGSTSSQGFNLRYRATRWPRASDWRSDRGALLEGLGTSPFSECERSTRATPQIRSSEREPGRSGLSSRLNSPLSARSTSGRPLCSGHHQRRQLATVLPIQHLVCSTSGGPPGRLSRGGLDVFANC